MDKDGIDASIGLAFSLDLFRRYKRSGILQAELRRIPGMSGSGTASLHLVEGAVVSCYIEDKLKGHTFVSKEMLIRLDNEKGPFEWRLHPVSTAGAVPTPKLAPATHSHSQMSPSLPSELPNTAVPRRTVSCIPGERLLSWTLPQRRIFIMVWQAIDGQKTVQEIKTTLKTFCPDTVVNETLCTLIKLNVVTI